MLADSIAAPVTAPGNSAVAIVRLSGPLSKEAVLRLSSRAERVLSEPRKLISSAVFDRLDGSQTDPPPQLDLALIAFFPGPQSFTGEDVAEFHLHASPFVVSRLLENLSLLGFRLAEPGEFSKRAFLNGKLDLCQAEAVADLINAESEAQARLAQQQLSGRFSRVIDELGEPLREILAVLEAHINFPEEEIETAQLENWTTSLEAVGQSLGRYIDSYEHGRRCQEGVLVVLTGRRNAGKSSLLNCLLGEPRAIVTSLPGTTRDSIEERIALSGYSVKLCDTAGLVSPEEEAFGGDPVEALGIERSFKLVRDADLVLYLIDIAGDFSEDKSMLETLGKKSSDIVLVGNKADLLDERSLARRKNEISAQIGSPVLVISALLRQGIAGLRSEIISRLSLEKRFFSSVLVSSKRHVHALGQAKDAVDRAVSNFDKGLSLEFAAVEIRDALRALEEIVGATPNEEILARIFSRFCIGK